MRTILCTCWMSCHRLELWPWPYLAQRWVGTWTHTDSLTPRCTFQPRVSCRVSCWLCQISELTYKYHCIKLLHMAPNPIHSPDILTPYYPVGKNGFFPPCTVTSSAMFEKKNKKTTTSQSLAVADFDMAESLSHILLMFSF